MYSNTMYTNTTPLAYPFSDGEILFSNIISCRCMIFGCRNDSSNLISLVAVIGNYSHQQTPLESERYPFPFTLHSNLFQRNKFPRKRIPSLIHLPIRPLPNLSNPFKHTRPLLLTRHPSFRLPIPI